MKVTRAVSSAPMRSASTSSARAAPVPSLLAGARARSSAASWASAFSVCSTRAFVWRCIVSAKRTPATTRARSAVDSAARNSLVWKEDRGTSLDTARRHVEQAVAELLDRNQRAFEHGQLFAYSAHVDVDGTGAASVFVAPDVGEQQIAREHEAPVTQEVVEQQKLF